MSQKPPKKIQKLPDPHGMIARVRRALNPKCSVAISPYRDIIISMQMQSVPYQKIEEWLAEQGKEYRISAATLWRNLKKTNLTFNTSYAEELAAEWGGRIDLDYVREVAGQVIAQRERVDAMRRHEKKKQETLPHYFDKRIKDEVRVLTDLLKTYAGFMQSPKDAAMDAMLASAFVEKTTMKMSEDAKGTLRDMLLNGELTYGEPLH